MRDYGITLTGRTLFLARVVTITRLDGTVLRIAEAETSITISAQTFTPLPGCKISAVKHLINGEVGSMEIRFAHSDGGVIDTAELNNGKWDAASVVAYLVDRSSLSALGDPLFTGVIDGVTLDLIGQGGSFDIRGITAQAEAFIWTYQPMCRKELFGTLCTLNKDDFDYVGTVGTIIDRFTFTVSGLGSPPADGWFNDGEFVTASGFVGVAASWIQSTLTLRTYQPKCVSHLTAGEGITLYPGCDKRATTCKDKFANKINFGGEDHFLGINSIVGL